MLTKTQKQSVEIAAKKSGDVVLYRETSMSGLSETLRWRRSFTEQTRWGHSLRSESGMILSVTIHSTPDGSDDKRDLDKYNALCTAAIEYFNSIRPTPRAVDLPPAALTVGDGVVAANH